MKILSDWILSEVEKTDARTFKAGCTITNIRNGKGRRQNIVYADLVDRDGVLIISATLPYIADQLSSSRICETDEPQMEYERGS